MTTEPRRAVVAHASSIAAVVSLGVAVGLRASGHCDMQRIPMLAALTYGVLALLLVISCDREVIAWIAGARRTWGVVRLRGFRRADGAHVLAIEKLAINLAPLDHAGDALARSYAFDFLRFGGRLGALYASMMLTCYSDARAAVLIDRERRKLAGRMSPGSVS